MKISNNTLNSTLSFNGGFNFSVTVYSVSRKGKLTPIANSYDCTWEGDAPSKVISVSKSDPVVVLGFRLGNGGWVQTLFISNSAEKRLNRSGWDDYDRLVD